MATLKQRLHRKNASGTYDTVHFESTSDLILRPSGRTVEQDLADYLPEVQNNDNVPESLQKLIIGSTKAWINGKEIDLVEPGPIRKEIQITGPNVDGQIRYTQTYQIGSGYSKVTLTCVSKDAFGFEFDSIYRGFSVVKFGGSGWATGNDPGTLLNINEGCFIQHYSQRSDVWTTGINFQEITCIPTSKETECTLIFELMFDPDPDNNSTYIRKGGFAAVTAMCYP